MTAPEDGSMALLVALAGMLLTAALLLLGAGATDLASTAARARAAADAAALAAAGASPLAGGEADPEAAAAVAAAANGAQLERLDLAGWPLTVQVVVSVEPGMPAVRAAVRSLSAEATARLRAPSSNPQLDGLPADVGFAPQPSQ